MHPRLLMHSSQDPLQRMGAAAGADEIKLHPWFSGINWALVRELAKAHCHLCSLVMVHNLPHDWMQD